MSDLAELKKAELIALCKEQGLSADGTKAQLIERLEAAESAPEAVEETIPEPVEESTPEPVVEEPAPAPAPSKPKAKSGAVSEPHPDDESLSAVDFIKQAYLSILGREADAGGLRHYRACLELHKTLTREKLLADLKGSEEYRKKNQ